MEPKTKKNIVIWGVVLLVLLNVSSLATIWLHRYQYSSSRIDKRHSGKTLGRHPAKMGRHGARSNAYFTNGLNLSTNQKNKFDSIWQKYSDNRQEIEQKMRKNRLLMSDIMNQLEVDTTQIYSLSANQGQLMQQLDLSMIKMNLALRTVLDADQMQLFIKKVETLSKRRGMSRQRNEH